MKLAGGPILVVVALAACGSDAPSLPPPLAEVPGTLGTLAVDDTAIFAIDGDTGALVELGLDGTLHDPLPTIGAVLEVTAKGDTVAWVEVEGSGTVVKRRVGDAGTIESQRTFDAHVIATDEGVFYSDIGLVASWTASVPERIATPVGTDSPRLLDVDGAFAYTLEADTSVVKYTRMEQTSEVLLPTSTTPAVRAGQLAYRTDEGVRLRDLFTMFDRVVGAVPASYDCQPLIVQRAVMCGRFRALEGTADELLRDPVGGYAAAGSDVYWVTSEDGVSSIRVVDAEAVTSGE